MTPAELKAARERLGLSQGQLAELLGMAGRGAVWRWESGAHPIPTLVDIAVGVLLKTSRRKIPKGRAGQDWRKGLTEKKRKRNAP